MTIIRSLLAAACIPFIVGAVAPHAGNASQDCRDWQACRGLAIEAKERGDFDAFHDLAWKAVGLGPKNDPALMTLLARAQSLSGRPLDAVVMLQRLAGMGVITDVATSDDFERVRALPAWNDLAPKLTGTVSPAAAPPPPSAAPGKAAPTSPPAKPSPTSPTPPPGTTKSKPAAKEPAPAVEKPKPAETAALPTVPPASATPATTEKPNAPEKPVKGAKNTPVKTEPAPLKFSASGVDAVGLAYDAVSGRFILGDRADRRLLVIGERSGRPASLAGVDAGFNEVTAFEIDTREGDLWVVSGSSDNRSSTVHKLQLISGRVLASIPMPEGDRAVRFVDVAVAPQSVLVLDSAGRRVLRLAKKSKTFEIATQLAVANAASLAPVSDTTAYVAYDEGILRADLSTRTMAVVDSPAKTSTAGVTWMRWFRDSLIAIQTLPSGQSRLVRIRMDGAGRAARSIDVLDENVMLAGPTSATISENAVYYLNRASDAGDVIVRKLPLK